MKSQVKQGRYQSPLKVLPYKLTAYESFYNLQKSRRKKIQDRLSDILDSNQTAALLFYAKCLQWLAGIVLQVSYNVRLPSDPMATLNSRGRVEHWFSLPS